MNQMQIIREIELLEASTSMIQDKLRILKKFLAPTEQSQVKKGGLSEAQVAKLLARKKANQQKSNMKLIRSKTA